MATFVDGSKTSSLGLVRRNDHSTRSPAITRIGRCQTYPVCDATATCPAFTTSATPPLLLRDQPTPERQRRPRGRSGDKAGAGASAGGRWQVLGFTLRRSRCPHGDRGFAQAPRSHRFLKGRVAPTAPSGTIDGETGRGSSGRQSLIGAGRTIGDDRFDTQPATQRLPRSHGRVACRDPHRKLPVRQRGVSSLGSGQPYVRG